MRMLRTIMAGALAVTLATACSDSTGVTEDDLVGTWVATAATFTPNGTTTAMDLLADGTGFTLVLQADGTYTATTTEPDSPPDVESGTYSVSGSVITLTSTDFPDDPDTFAVTLDGNTMTLIASNVVLDEEVGGPAGTLTIVLQRQ